MLPQQYCLRWKYHHSNLQTMFSQLLDRGCFCDVTLACEGQLIRAHRVVLCACSTFFDTVLTNYASERDPIIIMKDVTFADVKSLIEFMYKGEINVEHANLASLLKTADDLKIKGLAEVSWRDDEDGGGGAGSGGGGVGGLLPTFPDAEFLTHHSPPRTQDTYGGGLHSDLRGSPIADAERRHAGSPAPSGGKQALSSSRLPLLTPIPPSSITIAAAAAASADHYLGPKRKRGRPPLDDAYDVFNVRKLAHYAGHLEAAPSSHHEAGRLHAEEQRRHSSSAYQQHIHQQQRRQRLKHEHQQQQQQQQLHQHLHSHHHHHHQQQQQHATDSEDADDLQTDPEWITSNLEVNVNVGECETPVVGLVQAENGEESLADPAERKQEPNEAKEAKSPGSAREKTPESKAGAAANEKSSPKVDRSKKRSILEKAKEQRQRESREKELRDDGLGQHDDDEQQQQQRQSDHEDDQGTVLPQPVEEIESVQQVLQQQAAAAAAAATTTATSSSGTSSSSTAGDLPSTLSLSQSVPAKLSSNASHAHSSHSHTHSHSHSAHSHIPPAHSHFAKYGTPEGGGYMLNEHGMLMTHDFPPHSVMAAANGSNNNGGGDQDFVDIKMEDYDAADLRLTSEEMSQWQDVIKMDDYLAKGRRPQFWEEPFTRRVLDAIKNKRLEMKKAARILGVSYGTLYGRYREVYGCLKHPYSSTFRPSQSSQLAAAVQPRFDIVWPSPKRDSSLLSTPLEIGKIRPKDLSELWARPQI